MKQFLLTLIYLFTISSFLCSQVERKVIIEEFTNASCPPCAAQNPAFNTLLEQNEDKVISIKYQTAFPGFDPYNQQNPGDVSTRLSLYNEINGVPTAAIDGIVPGNNYGGGGLSTWTDAQGNGYNGGPYGYNQAVLDYAASVPTTIGVELTANVPDFTEKGTVEVQITNVDSLPFTDNSRLYIVLVERENIWPEPPGTTDEADFYNIMRDMYPSANGLSIGHIPADTMITVAVDVHIPDYIYDLSELSFIAFVQSQTTRTIYNADMTDRLPVPANFPNLAMIENTSFATGSLCDRTLFPSVVVVNDGGTQITSFDLITNMNGLISEKNIIDTIAIGDTLQIELDSMKLTTGSGKIFFTYENVNGSSIRPVNRLVNESPAQLILGVEQVDLFDLEYGFENDPSLTETPDGIALDNPLDFMLIVDRNNVSTSTPVGAYGNSDKAMLVNFFRWAPSDFDPQGQILFTREFSVDESASEIIISFDRAHAQRRSPRSEDALKGYVSYDCGLNWTLVYDKVGSDLSTRTPINTFFAPRSNQWETDSIRIPTMQNEQALFKFEVISDGGNNLFIDNIKLNGKAIATNSNSIVFNQQPTVYPNPSAGQSTLEFEVTKRQRMNISLYNAMGQVTHTIADREFPAGQYRIPLTLGQSSTGMYRILFTTEDGVESIPFVLTR